MAVTKKQIADHLGISRTAVSLTLNNTKNSTISEETKQRIFKAAVELGYREETSTDKVCFVLCNRELNDPRYAITLKSIEECSAKRGLRIVFIGTKQNDDPKALRDYISTSEVKGVILAGEVEDKIIQIMEHADVPYVAIMSTGKKDVNAFVPDSEELSYQATKYLLRFNHKKIAFFSGNLDLPVHQKSYSGYKRALAEMNIGIEKSLVQISDQEDGAELVSRMALLDIDYTGIFCANFMIQFSAIMKLKEIGKRVPDDVSLVGCGFSEFANLSNPKLTLLYYDYSEIAYELTERLFEIMDTQDKQRVQRLINTPKLFEGRSVYRCL